MISWEFGVTRNLFVRSLNLVKATLEWRCYWITSSMLIQELFRKNEYRKDLIINSSTSLQKVHSLKFSQMYLYLFTFFIKIFQLTLYRPLQIDSESLFNLILKSQSGKKQVKMMKTVLILLVLILAFSFLYGFKYICIYI